MFIKDVVNPQLCDTYSFDFKNVEAWAAASESFVTDLLEHAHNLGIQIDHIHFYSGFKYKINVWNLNL